MINMFSVSNPFSDKKCNKKNKHHSKKSKDKQEMKKTKNLHSNVTKKEKSNSGNNISSLLNTIKSENSSKGKTTVTNQNNTAFDHNLSNNDEDYSSDELPEASSVLSDSQLNNCKKEPSTSKPIKNNSILAFFNVSNSNDKNKEKNDNIKNATSIKKKYSSNYESSEEDSELPNPNEALSKSIENKMNINSNSKNDINKLQSIKDIKITISPNNGIDEYSNNNNNTIRKLNFDSSDEDTELPKSEDIFSNSIKKNIYNNDVNKNINTNEYTFKRKCLPSTKSIINNMKIKKESKFNKNNENIDLPKPNEVLLKEMNKNLHDNEKKENNNKKNNNKEYVETYNNNAMYNKNPFKIKEPKSSTNVKCSNIKDVLSKLQESKVIKNDKNEKHSQKDLIQNINSKNNSYSNFINNNSNLKDSNYLKENNQDDSDDDSVFPESKDIFSNALNNNNSSEQKKIDNKLEKNGLSIKNKNVKPNISSKLNSFKVEQFSDINHNSILNENKKRPIDSSVDNFKKNKKFMKKMTIENEDSDDDLDTLMTSEELFQKLTSEEDEDKNNNRLFELKKSKIIKQDEKLKHEKNAFDLMRKENHQELNNEATLKKDNKNKSSFKMKNLHLDKKIVDNKKKDKLKKKSKNSILNKTKDDNKIKAKPKISQKVTNKTISKIKNSLKKNNTKASLQTILTFSKQTEPSKNNISNETKKLIGNDDLNELYNDINLMNEIVEKQKSVSDKCNMIQKSLEKSESNHELFHSRKNNKENSISDKLDFKNEEPFIKKLKKWNHQKEQQVIKNDNIKEASSLQDDEDNKYNEQVNIFKQMVKDFENEEFDEDSLKFDFNSLYSSEKRKSKISLDTYLKSGRLLSLKKKNVINNTYNSQGDKATFKCPFCHYEYYEDIEKSVYNSIQNFLEINHMKKDGKIITFNIPLIKQYEFCRLHQAKLVIIPEGIKKGYPLHIKFGLLKHRINCFKDDLFDIVHGKKKSYFRELSLNEYKRLGTNKARNFNSLINRFEKILVGYYGSKGFSIMTEILQDIFFVKKHTSNEESNTTNPENSDSDEVPKTIVKTEKILTYELSKPQEPFEYIQEVLVPECGIRLIAEDNNLNKDIEEDLEKARKIMEDSNDFGLVVHEFNDNDL